MALTMKGTSVSSEAAVWWIGDFNHDPNISHRLLRLGLRTFGEIKATSDERLREAGLREAEITLIRRKTDDKLRHRSSKPD